MLTKLNTVYDTNNEAFQFNLRQENTFFWEMKGYYSNNNTNYWEWHPVFWQMDNNVSVYAAFLFRVECEDGISMNLQNSGTYLPNYMLLYPTGP